MAVNIRDCEFNVVKYDPLTLDTMNRIIDVLDKLARVLVASGVKVDAMIKIEDELSQKVIDSQDTIE